MISDRELSALVESKVFGETIRTGHVVELRCCSEPSCPGNLRSVRAFATDTGLALEAAMKARGSRGIEIIPQSGGKFLIPFEDIGEPNVYTYGLTLSRALSFAALRAAGVEVQDDTAQAAERQGE